MSVSKLETLIPADYFCSHLFCGLWAPFASMLAFCEYSSDYRPFRYVLSKPMLYSLTAFAVFAIVFLRIVLRVT